jgi:hypothetical protein
MADIKIARLEEFNNKRQKIIDNGLDTYIFNINLSLILIVSIIFFNVFNNCGFHTTERCKLVSVNTLINVDNTKYNYLILDIEYNDNTYKNLYYQYTNNNGLSIMSNNVNNTIECYKNIVTSSISVNCTPNFFIAGFYILQLFYSIILIMVVCSRSIYYEIYRIDKMEKKYLETITELY